MKKNEKLNEKDKDKIVVALRLIEYAVKQGKLNKTVFKKVLNEYRGFVDISTFSCYS